ncbi:MAG: hypothetical protein IJZ68_11565 [Bacteroidaceae bacterium]|nr:hypothetical protein [Bacteroidaceae bacterium]
MNKLKTYEAPSTRVAKVELRTNMLAGSIMEHKESKVEASEHETGFDNVDGGDSFTIEEWQ